jgi:hypothetical protein
MRLKTQETWKGNSPILMGQGASRFFALEDRFVAETRIKPHSESNEHGCEWAYDEILHRNGMKLLVHVAICLGALTCLCHAEPRWCSISQKDPSNKFAYPPIARAARVTGHVMMRMIYAPNGKVVRFEPISGPALLSNSLRGQLSDWTVKTDARGDELCETLVIAEFIIHAVPGAKLEETKFTLEPSIMRLSADTEPNPPLDIVISDPAFPRGFRLFRLEVEWKLEKLFGRSSTPTE